jgi:hypothetical protein
MSCISGFKKDFCYYGFYKLGIFYHNIFSFAYYVFHHIHQHITLSCPLLLPIFPKFPSLLLTSLCFYVFLPIYLIGEGGIPP